MNRQFSVRAIAASGAIGVISGAAWGQACTPGLLPREALAPFNNRVNALAIYDDGLGAGPLLYAGGAFSAAGTASAQRIARLTAAGWEAVGSPFASGEVLDLEVIDTVGEERARLWAVGSSSGVVAAYFDGSAWTVVPGPAGVSGLREVMSHNAGNGPAVYALGSNMFLYRWDGTTWQTPPASQVTGGSYSGGMVTFDADGPGGAAERLALGGAFSWMSFPGTTTSSVNISGLGILTDQQWAGSGHAFAWVKVVKTLDLGSGPVLHVTAHPGSQLPLGNGGVARWDGQTWQGLPHPSILGNVISAVAGLDHDGDGQRSLFGLSQAPIVNGSNLVRHDGTQWVGEGTTLQGLSDTTRRQRMVEGVDPCTGAGALYISPLMPSTGGRIEAYVSCPRCAADVDGNGSATAQDIYTYLERWIGGLMCGDFNRDGTVRVQDIYDFLTAWHAGCGE